MSTVNHVFFVGFFLIRLTVHFFYLPLKNETWGIIKIDILIFSWFIVIFNPHYSVDNFVEIVDNFIWFWHITFYMVYHIFYDYFKLKWYKNVTKLVENGMFLIKNILKLIKNSTFFIVIFIGFYWDSVYGGRWYYWFDNWYYHKVPPMYVVGFVVYGEVYGMVMCDGVYNVMYTI